MADSVETFQTSAMQLVQEATAYAKAGKFDVTTNNNIRACMLVCNVLMTALQQAQLPEPPPPLPQ